VNEETNDVEQRIIVHYFSNQLGPDMTDHAHTVDAMWAFAQPGPSYQRAAVIVFSVRWARLRCDLETRKSGIE
jgi:hypothetical protein